MVTLPVPEMLLALYLLPTSQPPTDAATLAADALRAHGAAHLRDRALQLLGRQLVRVDVDPVDRFPALETPLLGVFGARRAQLRALQTATHVVTVGTSYEVGAPAAHQWISCAVSSALTRALECPAVDAFGPRLLEHHELEDSLPGPDGVLPMARWVQVLASPDERGYWCTTLGLARFGLPELQTHDVRPHLAGAWMRVLTGLGQRLRSMWDGAVRARPAAPVVELPDLVTVSAADVAAAYRRDPAGSGVAEFRLRLDGEAGAAPAFLTTLSPEHFDGTPHDHQAAVCAALRG
jgi:hypothetical protein